MQLKEKRDAAIMELHKEGKSVRAIAAALGVPVMTVSDTTNRVYENALGANPYTPEVSTSAVPMASTEDRSETREDARS